MMTSASLTRSVRPGPRTVAERRPMSNIRFFLTSYSGGVAFFLTIIA